MNWLAIRMLVGDRGKFLGLVFGIMFSTLLMAQQVSVFIGIMRRTASQIFDVRDADVWVMDNKVRHIDEAPGLPDTKLLQVRGVPGVSWAAPMYKGQARARLRDGNVRLVILEGLDDASLTGAPAEMIAGEIGDLRTPNGVIIDKSGYQYIWPDEPIRLGREFEMNERRAVLVGVCKSSPPFVTLPVVYTRYSEALSYVPRERHLMNYILVHADDGQSPAAVAERIERETGLLALTRSGFAGLTIRYFLSSTGIPVNFSITIALGFIVGAAVAGQTFYLFTIENLKQFGALKAMGVRNGRLVRMILLQAICVGLLGYGIGVGLSALFFEWTNSVPHLAGLHLSWYVLAGTAAAVLVIIVCSALLSIRRVLVLEPAAVFHA